MNEQEKQIASLLLPFDKHIVALAQDLRAYLIKETNPRYELVARSTQSVNIGYAFRPKAWDSFVAIIIYRKHINISFVNGAFINDPDGLLHGAGKRIRHLKIKTLEDLKTPAAMAIIEEARELAIDELDAPLPQDYTLETRVKT